MIVKKKKNLLSGDEGEVQGGTERRDYKEAKETFLCDGCVFLIMIMAFLMYTHI